MPPTGQSWTTLESLRITHTNAWRALREDLYELRTQPPFAIGQRALLLRTAQGNILWDCIALLDQATIDIVKALGGINAIAISHPHYYTTMIEWAHAFGCPVFLHEDDREWVMRQGDALHYWHGDTLNLMGDTTLLRVGGHFPGGTILHYAADQGMLLTGDVLQVTPDRTHVSFMYSYPNYLPLGARQVSSIGKAVAGLCYERVYGSFAHAEIEHDGQQAVARSVERYLALVDPD
ncbi:hypothetical protein [Paraburkholderia tagetis]|uniref:Metallo-beta-lactamase domain-containing protein n=1 Tax=Paraburkholderia tagetis TaxID=2913261 RepID=A0A9X1UNB2_9BURK|nr:hypothetical protein [Paraburkholderia tagetis]MCG5078630.1 hypothetical protein [Paraburkholderia tagetis]